MEKSIKREENGHARVSGEIQDTGGATGSKEAGGDQHFLEVLGCVTNWVGGGGGCRQEDGAQWLKRTGCGNRVLAQPCETGFQPPETLDCFICEAR